MLRQEFKGTPWPNEEMALTWTLRDPFVSSAIIGASKPQQILENVKIVDQQGLTDEEIKIIESIVEG